MGVYMITYFFILVLFSLVSKTYSELCDNYGCRCAHKVNGAHPYSSGWVRGYDQYDQYGNRQIRPSCFHNEKVIVCTTNLLESDSIAIHNNDDTIHLEDEYGNEEEEAEDENDSCNGRLLIENSNISVISSNTFSQFPHIVSLDLRNNHVQQIRPDAFNNLQRLKDLRLSDNNITSIEHSSLHQLETLLLDNNNIRSIDKNSLLNGEIHTIRLERNKLTEFPEEILPGMYRLSYLNISQNLLKSFKISGTSFHEISSLDLSENQLESFEFLQWSQVVSLNISNNNLKELTKWHLSHVQYLYCNDNHLENMIEIKYENLEIYLRRNSIRILQDRWPGIKSLTILDVSYNSISTIDSKFFSFLSNLEKLFLQHNEITNIDIQLFKELTKLTHLDLSNNKISKFEQGTLTNLINLQVLNVSSNQLHEVFYDISLADLRCLYIDRNRISSLDADKLKSQSRYLQEISLGGNQWNCKKLMAAVFRLNSFNITLVGGDEFNSENIRGIACKVTTNNTEEVASTTSIVPKQESTQQLMKIIFDKFYQLMNTSFENSDINKYFQTDYNESNFFKYLNNHEFFNTSEVIDGQNNMNPRKDGLNSSQDGTKNVILVLILVVLVIMTCVNFGIIYFLRLGNQNRSLSVENSASP